MSILCNWGKVKHGVPQGSQLGPLFLVFYTDNLPKVIKITPNEFFLQTKQA